MKCKQMIDFFDALNNKVNLNLKNLYENSHDVILKE